MEHFSLRIFDQNPMAQDAITSQAMLFASLTGAEAKKNALSRSELINDVSSKRVQDVAQRVLQGEVK